MLVTVQQHILRQQEDQFPAARGNFSSLLSGMTLATKMIQAKIRRAGLVDILGSAGAVNVQGETQQKLDVYANQAVLHCLGARESVAFLVSEEDEQTTTIDRSEGGKYIVVFDPLDGSSNIDVNVSVGTIFSILRRPDRSTRRGRCSSVGLETGSCRLRGLRFLNYFCIHRGTRRVRFYARTRNRRLRAQLRQYENAATGEYVFRQRSQRR
jgi:fructose-1,6-bisphosphatase